MTLELAILAGPVGSVVAIEPAPGNLALLRRHLGANGRSDRVSVIGAACAESHGGSVDLFVGGDDAGAVGSGHTLMGARTIAVQNGDLTIKTLTVALVSIDGLCREHKLSPQLIKVDVDWAELRVIRGALEVLRRHRTLLRIGFHPFAFPDPVAASDDLRRLLASAAYRLVGVPAHGALALSEYVAPPTEAA